jgi:hypothetical protein
MVRRSTFNRDGESSILSSSTKVAGVVEWPSLLAGKNMSRSSNGSGQNVTNVQIRVRVPSGIPSLRSGAGTRLIKLVFNLEPVRGIELNGVLAAFQVGEVGAAEGKRDGIDFDVARVGI